MRWYSGVEQTFCDRVSRRSFLEIGSLAKAAKDMNWSAARPRQVKLAASLISTVAVPSAACWALARASNDEELLNEMRSPVGRDFFIFRGPAGQKMMVRIPFGGFGAMLTFEVKGDFQKTKRVCEMTQVFQLAVSLGAVESLIEQPASMSHASYDPAARRAHGIGDGLVRLSIGLEAFEDLTDDLDQAIAAAT